MTPAQAIAALNRQLAKHGETVTFRRPRDGSIKEVTVKAFVKFAEPSELVGATHQTVRHVIISPTGLDGWPDGHPDEDDWCIIAGQECSLLPAKPKRLKDVLVRVNLMAKG